MILYAATSNPGKLREFTLAALQSRSLDLSILPLPNLKQIPPPPEDGATFEENAVQKALAYSQFVSDIVFADDSGLVVEALEGAPGIYSARFAGENATDEENNRLLLTRLQNVENRRARFVCTIALARQGQLLGTVTGEVEGEILSAPRGAGGFGYDPIFLYPPLQRSFSELHPDEKLNVSHRGIALRKMLEFLKTFRIKL